MVIKTKTGNRGQARLHVEKVIQEATVIIQAKRQRLKWLRLVVWEEIENKSGSKYYLADRIDKTWHRKNKKSNWKRCYYIELFHVIVFQATFTLILVLKNVYTKDY